MNSPKLVSCSMTFPNVKSENKTSGLFQAVETLPAISRKELKRESNLTSLNHKVVQPLDYLPTSINLAIGLATHIKSKPFFSGINKQFLFHKD